MLIKLILMYLFQMSGQQRRRKTTEGRLVKTDGIEGIEHQRD